MGLFAKLFRRSITCSEAGKRGARVRVENFTEARRKKAVSMAEQMGMDIPEVLR